jgi:threonyl-tRNA synthetase
MEKPIAEGIKKVTEGVKNLATSDKPKKQQSKKKDKKGGQDDGKRGSDEMNPQPDFIDYRNHIFDKLRAEYDAEVAKKPRESITVTFPDGKTTVGKSWETTPGEIARNLSKSLYERTVISEVDGELWDLERPLEKNCTLNFLDFNDPKGKQVFWHSSAHVLGECSEICLGSHLVLGPPIDDGFYYEMSLPDGAAVVPSDIEPIERVATKMIKEKQPFVRLTLSKENLLEMFKYNKYKQHLINDKIPDGTSTTVYKNGKLIDLCRGPHVCTNLLLSDSSNLIL